MAQIMWRPLRAVQLLLALSLGLSAAACNSPAQRSTAQADSPSARETVAYLASDQLEGRGVGTKGIDAAADYIASRFEDAGLRPPRGMDDYFQQFSIMAGAKVEPDSQLRAGGESFALHEQFRPLSFSKSGTFDAPVVFAGYGISSEEHQYDDYAGLDVRGKIVLAMRYEPHTDDGKSRFAPKKKPAEHSKHAGIEHKANVAAERGAAALLLVTPPNHHKDTDLLPLAQRFAGGQVSIPVVHVKAEVADTILSAAGAPKLAELQETIDEAAKPASRELSSVEVSGDIGVKKIMAPSRNVMAVLPGSGPRRDEYIVVGAHYDHVGRGNVGGRRLDMGQVHNGADDNASGTAVLLQLAEQLAAAKHPPERSILFVAFTGEEWGLLGSAEFVREPPVPLERIVAMLNLDMVGRVRDQTLYVGGSGTAEAFDAILKAADEASPLKLKDIGRGGFGPSDHMSFALKKIPVLFLFSGLHGDYHRPTDDADKVNYDGIEQVTDLAVDLVRDLAEMPKQQYASGADAKSFMGNRHGSGSGGGPTRVTLGVVPDYSSEEIGGLRISGVVPGSPAEAAGLREDDIIVQIDEKKIANIYDLTDVLANGKAGQRVKVLVQRDGQTTELQATFAQKG